MGNIVAVSLSCLFPSVPGARRYGVSCLFFAWRSLPNSISLFFPYSVHCRTARHEMKVYRTCVAFGVRVYSDGGLVESTSARA